MKPSFIFTLFISVYLLAPTALFAQGEAWSQEQKEAWAAVVADYDALKAGSLDWDGFAENYRGWAAGMDAPYTKAERRPWGDFYFKNNKVEIVNAFPLAVDIHGDVAIAFYSYTMLTVNTETGEPTPASGKYVDILRKVDGEWLLIADVGFDDE
jgi:hypothetical protein